MGEWGRPRWARRGGGGGAVDQLAARAPARPGRGGLACSVVAAAAWGVGEAAPKAPAVAVNDSVSLSTVSPEDKVMRNGDLGSDGDG